MPNPDCSLDVHANGTRCGLIRSGITGLCFQLYDTEV